MTLYKLTDQDGETYGHTKWGPGITHSGTGSGDLCGPGWIHAYTHPLLAVFLNPIHGNFQNPRLWVAMGDVVKTDHGLKVGCQSLMTTCEIDVPKVTIEQRVRFAILCAMQFYKNTKWRRWAGNWLSDKNRSRAAAYTAAADADVATTAAGAAADAAVNAAHAAAAAAAAHAAYAAAYAAHTADAAAAAVRAANAAADYAADTAAGAAGVDAALSAAHAADAAGYAHGADDSIDFIQLAQLAVS